MNYIEVILRIENDPGFVADLLTAGLAEVGYESFEPTSRGLKAYIPASGYDNATLSGVAERISEDYKCKISYLIQTIADRNWNEAWEQNGFTPITIDDQIAIFPTSHKDNFTNVNQYRYLIELNPRQSFGSGYHETTRMMLSYIEQSEMQDRAFLDMGCGTAVLAILARMKGARPVVAIDIDQWSVDNALENSRLNKLSDIDVRLGDATTISTSGIQFDYICANINRNILLRDLTLYAGGLRKGGTIVMSGFYKEDLPLIDRAAEALAFHRISCKEDNGWIAAAYMQ